MERDVCFIEPFRESLKNLNIKVLSFWHIIFLEKKLNINQSCSFLESQENGLIFLLLCKQNLKKKERLWIITAFSIAVIDALQPKIHLNCFYCFYREVCGADLYYMLLRSFWKALERWTLSGKLNERNIILLRSHWMKVCNGDVGWVSEETFLAVETLVTGFSCVSQVSQT